MAAYAYSAINAEGIELKGEVHAPDLEAAREQLRIRGLLADQVAVVVKLCYPSFDFTWSGCSFFRRRGFVFGDGWGPDPSAKQPKYRQGPIEACLKHIHAYRIY